MEKMQTVDHRHKHRGFMKKMLNELAESGSVISPSALTRRIQAGKNEETMRIYFRLLKRWNRIQEREERRKIGNRKKAQQLRNQTKTKQP